MIDLINLQFIGPLKNLGNTGQGVIGKQRRKRRSCVSWWCIFWDILVEWVFGYELLKKMSECNICWAGGVSWSSDLQTILLPKRSALWIPESPNFVLLSFEHGRLSIRGIAPWRKGKMVVLEKMRGMELSNCSKETESGLVTKNLTTKSNLHPVLDWPVALATFWQHRLCLSKGCRYTITV